MTSIPRPAFIAPLITAFRAWQSGRVRDLGTATHRSETAPRLGHVSLVGAGPGSADLITLRGLQRLQAADVVYYDRLADPALLDHAPRSAQRIYVGKAPGCHSMPQTEINRLLVNAGLRGLQVVRLKCGDPGIFGRGAEEAEALDAAGVPWDIVPGVTSACAAAASARSFLTVRGQTERLILVTGHLRAEGAAQDWSASAIPGTTLACYMSVAQAGPLQAGLLVAGWPATACVQIVSRAQTAQERIIDCDLGQLQAVCAATPGLNPAILLIRWPLAATAPTSLQRAEQALA